MSKVSIIDYQAGNMRNIARAFEVQGASVEIISTPEQIRTAERLVLPGVGAFGPAAQHLEETGLADGLRQYADSERPLLGICLGMQLLFEHSQEFGNWSGLGLLPGEIVPMSEHTRQALRIPHTNWSPLTTANQAGAFSHPLLTGVEAGTCFYFVHSLMAQTTDARHRLADCQYGDLKICAAAGKDSVMGLQFHPEKSGPAGLALLKNFMAL